MSSVPRQGISTHPDDLALRCLERLIDRLASSDTVFNCVFCNAPKSINIAMDRKENIGHLRCKICGQQFSSVINGAFKSRLWQEWRGFDAYCHPVSFGLSQVSRTQ